MFKEGDLAVLTVDIGFSKNNGICNVSEGELVIVSLDCSKTKYRNNRKFDYLVFYKNSFFLVFDKELKKV